MGHRKAGLIAIVGAGGKTSLLFALAETLGSDDLVVTTTTHLRDPRSEVSRRFSGLLLEPALARPRAEAAPLLSRLRGRGRGGPAVSGPLIVAADRASAEDKLIGIDPSWGAAFLDCWEMVLVEADGARGLPIKAPAAHEPVIPACATLVIGVVGLASLGKPADAATVHRPELFFPLVACPLGAPIEARHLVALVESPDGLFKGTPPSAQRCVLFNQEDVAPAGAAASLARELARSRVNGTRFFVGSLRAGLLRSLVFAAPPSRSEARIRLAGVNA